MRAIRSEMLERLVKQGQIRAFKFERRDDTGSNPYTRLELEFLNGTRLVVIPEDDGDDNENGLGLYGGGR